MPLKGLPPKPKNYNPIRRLVDTYYDIQKLRIQTFNRIVSDLYYKDLVDGKISVDSERAMGKYSNLAKAIIKGEEEAPSEHIHEIVNTFKMLEARERKLAKTLEDYLANNPHPLHAEYLKNVKGAGPVLSAAIIAYGPYSRFPTISRLWKYSGLLPRDKLGTKYSRRMKRLWMVSAMTFLKMGEKSPYYRLYKKYKEKIADKHPDWSRRKVHIDALKRTAKIFASHIWYAWHYHVDDRIPPLPYAITHLGHVEWIDPWIIHGMDSPIVKHYEKLFKEKGIVIYIP